MEMEVPSNSHKTREERRQNQQEKEKKIEKVVTGTVKTRKSGIRKFRDEFISEDAKNVKSYVFGEVLIPAIKKAISDIVTDGISMILYGESRGGNRRSTADRVSYTNYSRSYRNDRPAVSSRYSYDDIILSSRGEAEDVLTRMDEIMATYGLVSVSDLYDLVGITGDWTDNDYGWTNITSAEIKRVRDGWTIKMPRAIPIK